MTIAAVLWDDLEGYDLHVLAGQVSRPLDDLLIVKDPAGTTFHGTSLPPGVTLRFFAEFAGAPGPAHGVTLNPITGEVTVAAALPIPRLTSFLIRAEVTEAGTVFAETPRIRIHVHQALAGRKAWITPGKLTVHVNAQPQWFSVLAEFDDGTIGDLTRMPGIVWNSGAPTLVGLTADGAISASVDGVTIAVTATLPASWGGLVLSASVATLPAWSTPRAATLVPGCPGAAAMSRVPNVLFIPDGFTAADEPTFRQYILQIVHFLRRDLRTSPYDHLKHSVNYWIAWIPSPERGCSVLHEAVPALRAGKLRADVVPRAVAPTSPGAPWSLGELINEVGLPVAADAIPDGTPAAAITARFTAKLADWTTLYGPKVLAGATQLRYTQWCALAERRLLDERDTGLGLTAGGRPNHQYLVPGHYAVPSWLRARREDLDAMFLALTDGPGGATIGATWGSPTGKDRKLVFGLLGGTRGAGAQASDMSLSTVVSNDDQPYVAPGAGRSMTIIPHPFPKRPPPSAMFTVAHETAHAIDLKDEYGHAGRVPASWTVPELNVQSEASLLAVVTPPPPAVRGLDGRRLKWLWPRIQKAGVLTATPTQTAPATYALAVAQHPDRRYAFRTGDFIQIRKRPLIAAPVVSDLLVITAVTPTAITAVSTVGLGANPPTGYPAGSVVYAPLPGPPRTLVADVIRDHITATGLSLDAPFPVPGAPRWTCGAPGASTAPYQIARNLPPGLVPPAPLDRYPGWIVGAYEGGLSFQCGVYHPAGACMMRRNLAQDGTVGSAYTFCPVCRYVLVDTLDPTQHGPVEQWIATRSLP